MAAVEGSTEVTVTDLLLLFAPDAKIAIKTKHKINFILNVATICQRKKTLKTCKNTKLSIICDYAKLVLVQLLQALKNFIFQHIFFNCNSITV